MAYMNQMSASREWWVSAAARTSGHPSSVGPFATALDAADFAERERPVTEWRRVVITSRMAKAAALRPGNF